MTLFEPKIKKNQGITAYHARQTERGSVIFWVLIMVGLFAALSFVASQGSRTGKNNMSQQQADLAATEILDYASAIKRAVQELQINGCSDTEISFENSVVSDYSTVNSLAPTDNSCHIFHPNGGGLRYVAPNINHLDNSFSKTNHLTYGEAHVNAHHCVDGIGSHTNPCTPPSIDLIFNISFLKKDICMAINQKIGLESINDFSIKESSSHSLPIFNGAYGPVSHIVIGDEVTAITRKLNGCTQDSDGFSDNAYIFHQVLIAR